MDQVAEHPAHLLYVLRHAKSSWKEPGQQDYERALAPRGRKAARLISRHLEQAGVRPALVLCSPARRARETYEGVAPSGELVLERELYGAGADGLLERLREVPEAVDSVMVIGHNPGLQELVLLLAQPRRAQLAETAHSASALRRVREKFPTCALATLCLRCRWRELRPGRAELQTLVAPADLA